MECPNRTEACGSCSGSSSGDGACEVRKCLAGVKRKIVVLSGKGGVGKSTVAVNLAAALAQKGLKTGLLDVDIHGPSVPSMLGQKDVEIFSEDGKLLPTEVYGLKVVSIGYMLSDPDDAVVLRGPAKYGVIKQFLSEVAWGDLDCLVVDCPPGTGDEPLAICQMIPDPTGAIVVTTPQEVAAADVRKSLRFCLQLDFPILGIVENMSGFVCPHCGQTSYIFPGDAGERLAMEFNTVLLGRIPLDPSVCGAGDTGHPFSVSNPESPSGREFASIVKRIML